MFGMLGIFGEFERAMIQERVKSGLARAKAQGKRLGRPGLDEPTKERVRAARAAGKSVRQIAAEFKIGLATVLRATARPAAAVIE